MRSDNQQYMFSLIKKKPLEQSTKAFCGANGISEATYYYWLKKPGKQPMSVNSAAPDSGIPGEV